MSTSVIRAAKRRLIVLTSVWIFLIVFSKVYNIFGHGVRSIYMDYMFLPFLIFDVSLFVIASMKMAYGRTEFNIMSAGCATFTAGCLLKGIFDIAGTSSSYTVFFFIAGAVLVTAAFLLLLWNLFRKE